MMTAGAGERPRTHNYGKESWVLPAIAAAETPPVPSVTEESEEPPEEPGTDAEEPAILAEVVIEELSIDGMCGVY